MGVIRRLVTVVELQADKAAKALAKYDTLWKQTAKSVGSYAFSIESDANRVIAATQRMAAAVASAPRPGRGGSGGAGRTGTGDDGGGSVARMRNAPSKVAKPPKGGDDLDRAIAAANKAEGARVAGQAKASAQMAGLAAGTASINAASAALGVFATKSDKARAAVRDFEAQVARNRKEMADLKAQALATGDADGTLTDRMRGLSVATGQAQVKLADARKELRAVDGGLIDAVKNSKAFSFSLGAMSVAAGNFISAGLSRAVREVGGAVVGATEKAIKFESAFADVKKVLPDDMSVEKVNALEQGLLKLGPTVGVLPTQMAELTANLAQSGIAGDQLLSVAEDASKVGVAFDLTGAEAGHAFASIQAALGTTRGETNSLFDTINELSNGMNSTAAQLVEVEERVGSVGRAMSLSGETVAALGSALVSTGASSEVAATGVRTFLARLGAGEAATDKQLKAFKALGLSAKDVARELSSGDTARAEKQIRGVVSAIEGLKNEDTLPTLIELFGSESIGTIGALATNTKLLGDAFAIAGDKTKAAGSVQREFENRSKTTEHQIAKLKAGVEVLAIEFGNALLPHINKVVEFLNSPEGQEWGRGAVEKAVAAVTSLASGIGTVASLFSSLSETLGGTATALGAVGLAALALSGPAGPFMAAALAGVAAGKMIVDAFMSASQKMTAIREQANAITKKETEDRQKAFADDMSAEQKGQDEMTARRKRAQDLADKYYRAKGKGKSGDELLKVFRESNQLRTAVEGNNRLLGGGTEEDRLTALQAIVDKAEAGGVSAGDKAAGRGAGGDQARFAALSRKVKSGQKLKPSEAEEYAALSESLDRAKASKGRTHKATKMDKQLAAMDPAVAALLTRGGDSDAGGDLKRADNVLDRAVFAKATGSGAGGGGVGPGPNVTTIYNDNKTLVNVQVDASSSAPAVANMERAATEIGNASAGVRFVGAAKVKSYHNAGGRMG